MSNKKTNKTNKVEKTNKNKVNNKSTNLMISTDNEMSKLVLLIIIVGIVFAAFYIVTLFVTKNDKEEQKTEETTEVTIQYQKILVGNILSQKDKEYYVLAYFEKDQYVDLYKKYLEYYKTLEGTMPYYFVNMDESFNKQYVGEKSKLNVSEAKDFKFKETTLLRIQDGKVISMYEGKDSITGKLGRMTK